MKNRTTILITMLPLLTGLAFLPGARAISPAPDGCFPNFTTAEGCDALSLLTTGAGNTALGWRSLFLDSTGSSNTGVGGGALVLNNGSSNTAVGAVALLLNTSGVQNVAVGTDALVFNDTGSSNTAVGVFALFNNIQGFSNVAIGEGTMLSSNSDYNTALGFNAGQNLSAAGFDNIYIGDTAGTLDNTGVSPGDESGVIRIGSIFSGGAACFINGIGQTFQPIGGTVFQVTVDTSTGQLGWDFGPNQRSAPVPRGASLPRSAPQTADGPDLGGFSPTGGIRPPAIPEATQQAMLNLKVQNLRAKFAQQQQQIEKLTAQLKENAEQIQKASVQLEMSKPVTKVVANKN